jgi:protocatechuate 3,4-dioxygenase beta subunit
MPHVTRRQLLAVAASLAGSWPVVARGICALHAQGLGDFTSSAGVPTCNGARQPTPAAPAEFYKPDAPTRKSLRLVGMEGSPLTLSGAVIGLKCGVIKDAQVELWQADAAGKYYDTSLRGQLRADAKGAFAFDTIVPGAAPGQARRLHLRVTPPGKSPLATVLFFPDDPARTSDPLFKPALVMKADPAQPHSIMTFDVVFDL